MFPLAGSLHAAPFKQPVGGAPDPPPPAASCVQINTSNLERVRRIKNRMVRLTTRVETVR